MDTTFAIVGTAGRKDDAERLSVNHFEAMYECAFQLLKQFEESEYGVDQVVSGGAAWADHVAVRLFLEKKIEKLKLCFPCQFDASSVMFDPTPLTANERQRGYSTGEIANNLHRKFSRKLGRSSLNEILLAVQQGAEVIFAKGFYARNAIVAKSDIILAMTFGENEWMKDGGTAHTMQTYLNRIRKLGCFDKSFHYDLNSGELYCGAKTR